MKMSNPKFNVEKVFPRTEMFRETSISNKSLILNNSKNQVGQARKSVGRMTWHQEPKKDVTSCDKPGLGANIHRPPDFRMGKPTKAIP